MKNFLMKFTGLFAVAAVLFFSACEEDPITPTNPLGPDIQLVADPGFVDGDTDIEVGEGFAVKVQIFTGDAQLKSVQILLGSSKLPTSRFTIDGGAIASNNPFLITGADKDGVTYEIDINAGSEAVNDVNIYTIEVTDENNETDAVDVAITTVGPSGTALSGELTGVLLNQAGPVGTGGLNLDTGTGTGSADVSAEIRDLGIDCTIPNTSENWRAQFGTVNGAEMRKVDPAQLENFTFDNVGFKETILAAYDTGINLSNGISYAPNCDETTVTDVTGTVAAGDMFVVFANSTYYLLRIDEINYVHSASDATVRNNDNFVFSIKF
ncbi:MAG: hypothetical protein KDC54_24155 [Lewinella sp.]|nr:hypothetical protein [Lewinella sp.]